jgi:hypothetical protein
VLQNKKFQKIKNPMLKLFSFIAVFVMSVCFSVLTKANGNDVVPIDWEQMGQPQNVDKDFAQCRRILSNSLRYNLLWLDKSFKIDEQKKMYIIDKFDERGIRPIATVCYAISFALMVAKMTEGELGVSPEVAMQRLKYAVKGTAAAYKKNRNDGKGFGDQWQSALWAAFAGHGAWFIWNQLDTETKTMVQIMLVSEADRFIAPNYKVPYWSTPDGKEVFQGDTKAEENAWNANILMVATAMMPKHPHYEQWKNRCSELIISAFSLKSDLQNEKIVDGKPLKDWLHGFNVREDGAVVNHGFVHPDYTSSVTLNLRSCLIQPFAQQKIFEGSLLNVAFIYRSLTEHVWQSPPYVTPGGTMYQKGKAEVYYPQNTDWSRYRFDIYYLYDVCISLLDNEGLKDRAAEWMRIRADRIETMQKRHPNGKMWAVDEYKTYPGCEQMLLWQLTDAYSLFYLHSMNKNY